MKIKSVLFLLLWVGGCHYPINQNQDYPEIEGVLSSVNMFQEDSSNVSVVLQFDDGRVQKLRAGYKKPLNFQIGKTNKIQYESNGTIIKIVVGGQYNGKTD